MSRYQGQGDPEDYPVSGPEASGDRRAGRSGSAGRGRSPAGRRSGRNSPPPRGGRAGRPGGRGRTGGSRRGPRWAPFLGAHWVLALVGIFATLVVVSGALTAYATYRGTIGSIHQVRVNLIGKRPPVYNSAENVLVIGAYNDVKDFTSHTYKPTADNGADTYVLVHIVPNHKGAVLLSFPRDAMVPVYACKPSPPFGGQTAQPGALEPLNQTYSDGGPGCAWETIEQQTGIRISHFIEVDYLGFEKFVEAINGVSVCLPYSVNIPNDGLRLKKGLRHINGAQALKFVRARDIGQWSDLQRIQRQQFFMISVMQAALHEGLLSNPFKLLSIAHAVAPYLTTDSGFGLLAMYGLARSMQGVNLSNVQLIEVPTVTYQPNPLVNVIWQPSVVDPLFSAIAHDRKVPKPAAAKPSPHATPVPTVKPSRVSVDVLNGTSTFDLAANTGSGLTGLGFHVIGTGNAPGGSYTTSVIEYGSASQLPAVNTLAKEVPGAQFKHVSGTPAGTIQLILGASFTGLGKHRAAHHGKAPAVSGLAKTYNGVRGNVSICHDQSAFAP